jgi:hypothetical protein
VPGWEAHHRQVPERAMTATCVISRPGAGPAGYDPVSGVATLPPTELVYGTPDRPAPCRAQAQSFRPVEKSVGERPRTVHRYLLVVPLDCPRVLVGDQVQLFTATDVLLVGTKALVLDFPVGSLVWERDLICEVLAAEN